ncbi:UNVERIFIED_CONTAM: UDP-glycosyltransferase TURAN [Sesamum indicum]
MGKRNRVAVVVLGDIGRSPRMQYHALSLARQACLDVDIVGYGGSEPHISVLQNQSIHIHRMPQWPTIPRSLPKILHPLFLILKPIIQFLMLLWYLCVKIPAPDAFLVQNPPSVPTLVVVKWASWLRHSAIIVDWHNFGYTLLALSLGRSSLFVAIYRWIEKSYGERAHGSLCVTKAMQHELSQNWGIKATVLYDQPPEFFRPASLEEKHNVSKFIWLRWHKESSKSTNSNYGLTGPYNSNPDITPFTTQVGTDIILKPNRPALIVSSTSWTPDEDFGILLEAALMYDRRVAALLGEDDSSGDEVIWDGICGGKQFPYPRLLFIITGKGPEKEKYEEMIRKLSLRRVAFRTMWLAAEDYPLLLGCGYVWLWITCLCCFIFLMLFEGFPERCDALKSMRSNLMERVSSVRWTTEWEENAKPLIYESMYLSFRLSLRTLAESLEDDTKTDEHTGDSNLLIMNLPWNDNHLRVLKQDTVLNCGILHNIWARYSAVY